MKQSHFNLSIAALLAVSSISKATAGTQNTEKSNKKPNVLFLAVDDWNDMLGGSFQNSQAVTPNLNRLMQKGIAFVNNHTAASFSTPSRTALMTGMAPWNSGCYENQPHLYNIPDRITIDELMQANGYKTYGAGKVYHHMPGFVNLDGFDEYFLWNPEHRKKGWSYDAWNGTVASPGKAPNGELGKAVYDLFDVYALDNKFEKDMADTQTTDWAVEVIKRKHKEPFFLAVGLYSPHKPNYAPQKYFDMHPLDKIELPKGIRDHDFAQLPAIAQQAYKARPKNHKGVLSVGNGWKKAIQGYLACCSYADAQLGKILDQLYNSPNADNTIIVFWSDNGYHLGEKEIWAKHTMYKRTTNVPMIWAGPGISVDKIYDGITSLLDIFPTLIEKCELNSTQKMDGESITKILTNPGNVDSTRIAITSNRTNSFSVFTDKWHYMNHFNNTGEELYDVRNDKYECKDLAMNPTFSEVLSKLRQHVPAQPVAPGLENNKGIKLICEGETFHWVESVPVVSKKKEKRK